MKLISLLLILFTTVMNAQEPKVYTIEPVPNNQVIYTGNLKEGCDIEDLSWAWNSSIACFTELERSKFTGKHLFFTGVIPKYSEMTVTVVPDNPSDNFSIYAYEVGVNNKVLVPHLTSCIRCEADYFRERDFVGREPQDHTRTVGNLVAINRPYRVVIGVTGANGLAEGGFTLKVAMKSR